MPPAMRPPMTVTKPVAQKTESGNKRPVEEDNTPAPTPQVSVPTPVVMADPMGPNKQARGGGDSVDSTGMMWLAAIVGAVVVLTLSSRAGGFDMFDR